jgi:hypothetical protein
VPELELVVAKDGDVADGSAREAWPWPLASSVGKAPPSRRSARAPLDAFTSSRPATLRRHAQAARGSGGGLDQRRHAVWYTRELAHQAGRAYEEGEEKEADEACARMGDSLRAFRAAQKKADRAAMRLGLSDCRQQRLSLPGTRAAQESEDGSPGPVFANLRRRLCPPYFSSTDQ